MTRTELFSVRAVPVLQNRAFASRSQALASPTGDVVLVQDHATGLIHNEAFDPGLLRYDEEYQNEQAVSRVFQRHLDDVTTIVQRHFDGLKLIEVGCGKAHFLEHLQQRGFDILGIDPAYEGNNQSVIKAPFEAGLGICAQGIVLRHVLEHIPDPLAFLRAIAQANGGSGRIYIEVPCFDWICRQRAWFDIFYEHVNYFRLQDLHRMFETVLESGHIFNGQYLYVVADLASLRQPQATSADTLRFPHDFLQDIGKMASIASSGNSAIWGGASKGVIFSLYMQRAGADILGAIDINPAKQGRYMACSGLRINTPQEGIALLHPCDTLFVMNSNYLQEIISMTANQYHYIAVDHHEL